MDITATNNQQNNRVDPPSHSKMLNLDEGPEETDFMLNETNSRMPDREISGILKDGMDRTIEEDVSINIQRRSSAT